MTVDNSKSWVRGIRQQVFELVGILIALITIAASFQFWSHYSINRVREDINNYHLVANSHYLRAMEDLRELQSYHVLKLQTRSKDDVQNHSTQVNLDDSRQKILQYLVDEKIGFGLALEKQYSDYRFTSLSKRLGQQLYSLSEFYTVKDINLNDAKDLLQASKKLLTTLDQIIRLHSIAREDSIKELHETRHFLNNSFYILMISLLVAAALVARRGLASINLILRKQITAEEIIEHQARYDDLTNLPNRFLALDRLSQLIRAAQRNNDKIAVLFIDLDYFKKVNDMLGHLNADMLLVEVAQRISHAVRASDTVGRLGGDEFIVLAGGISSADEVTAIAETLVQSINEVFVLEGKELILTCSVGISVYPDDGNKKLELIRKADSAMYHSKASGRNTYSYFDESMNRNVSRQLALEEQIHGALDRGEFEVVYQQKVELASNRIIGAEALLRWNNRVLGTIPPDEFIPVAEQTGLIVRIGQFVLLEALNMTQQWREELLPDFKIAVNLSPRQFRDPELVNSISRALHESGVPSNFLELEITEGVLMSEHVHIDKSLESLSKLGIVIAMDDFGTGYSSLSYLRNYPFGVIKIDRSFIQDIDRNSKSLKLNQAAISMAHALDLKVVAEGVETQAQFAALQELQCDIAQGYYFGRPVSAQQMTEVLQLQHQEHCADTIVKIADRPAIPANERTVK